MRLVRLDTVFKVQYGVNLALVHLAQSRAKNKNALPFVSRTANNNGVSAYVEKVMGKKPNPKHTLSVAGGGSVLATFYQGRAYYSGRDVYVLTPSIVLSKKEMLVYSTFIRANKYRYNYGRQANKTLHTLAIPDPSHVKKIASRLVYPKKPTRQSFHSRVLKLTDRPWRMFAYTDIFKVSGSKTTPPDQIKTLPKGPYPYIRTQATHNGTAGFYHQFSETGNVITVDSAVLGYASYQKRHFLASDHVEKLIPKFPLNPYIALFLVTLLNQEQYRYNYGRGASQSRLKTMVIKLPVDQEGQPDWLFMEDYIKSLPYSQNLATGKY